MMRPMRGLQFRRSADGKERASIHVAVRVTRGELERLKRIARATGDEVRDLLERQMEDYVDFGMWTDAVTQQITELEKEKEQRDHEIEHATHESE